MKNIQKNKIIKFIESQYRIFYCLLLILLIFNIFYKINTLNISFDEARHGVSAYEMLNKKQYIINTFRYKNDYWNLKPILSFLPVMLGFKLAGFNMVGLRLFSCISTLLTIIAVTQFVKHKHGKLASLISFAVLATNVQYILYHCSRGAEPDAVYILFFTLSVLCISASEKKTYFLYLSALFCSLAFLTKSFHVISLIAILGIYLFASCNFRKLKLSQWLIMILCLVLPILLWGILRYNQDGFRFFENMINYDLLDRSSNSIEGHTGGIFYYMFTILRYNGAWFIILIPCTVYYVFSNFNKITKNKYILLIALWIILPFVLFSIAKTKIKWYILPIYPPLAICCGAMFSKFIKQLAASKKTFICFAIIILIVTLSYESFILYFLHNYKDDAYQASIRQVSELKLYNNFNLYTTKGNIHNKGIWTQTNIFAAELYGNFNTKNGGFCGFFKDKTDKTMIISPVNSKTMNYINRYHLKVVFKTNKFMFIIK